MFAYITCMIKQTINSEIEYVCGLIDSEGSFRLRKHKNRKSLSAEFKLEMTSFEAINFSNKILGNKKIKQQNRPNRKIIYNITFGKEELRKIIPNLLPFLNEKYNQASIILDYILLDLKEQQNRSEEFYKSFLENKYSKQNKSISVSYPYLAGILDGDGYICILQQKTNKTFVKLGLEQCYKQLPEFLSQVFGGNFQHRKSTNVNHRDTYVWSPRHKECKVICENCHKYMIEKKEKAKKVIEILSKKEHSEWFRYNRWNKKLNRAEYE